MSTRHAPVVAVPPIQTRRLADGTVTVTLPASRLGFTEGSAVLPADADSTLAAVIAPAKAGRFTVEVAGYVADWGSLAYQQELSQQRAAAVAERLSAAGVPRDTITAIGRAAADGPAASRTRGVFDEAKVRAAGIRRVVITLRPRG